MVMQYEKALAEENHLYELAAGIFEQYDRDGNGVMDMNELGTFMRQLSEMMEVPPPALQDIQAVIDSLDQNQDGKLSFEEIKPLLVEVTRGLMEM